MRERKQRDADWRGARTWSLVYPAGEDVDAMLRDANELYLFENALNPFRFPSLREMEVEVVEMAGGLLHAPPGMGGAMTSGGTESILIGVLTARERARAERGVERAGAWSSRSPRTRPSPRRPMSRHRAAPGAAGRRTSAPTSAAAEKLITPNTVLLVGLGAELPVRRGRPDPRARRARRRARHRLPHRLVSRRLPAAVLREARRAGAALRLPRARRHHDVRRRPQVRLLHEGRVGDPAPQDETLKKHQLFFYDRWPGGTYGSFAMAGARPAAPIAAAWAILNYLGEDGYLRLARAVRDTTRKLRAGSTRSRASRDRRAGDERLRLRLRPLDVFGIGDVMDEKGWHLDRQRGPDALHLMVSPEHARIADRFLEDLREAARCRTKSRRAPPPATADRRESHGLSDAGGRARGRAHLADARPAGGAQRPRLP